ncbi:flagellar basal body L-ring protein FlgH [Uliginosibacterium sp. H1]|uniref:flagellar basal body L-ring protein FlgH n=1 Tax=Uliginosibacterium sp. H1 TaxID=3114757 RepID=UPI002E19DD24|nr:flagellar basal body L-ring protein FlgH [Uliginosibacterium sp. H1]
MGQPLPQRVARNLGSAVVLLGVSACAITPPTSVHQPMSVRPEARVSAPTAGSIYNANGRSLFEDRRARYVGDTIIVNLVERTSASKAANSAASRGSGVEAGITSLQGVPGKFLAPLSVGASTDSSFTGQGSAGANNTFNGTIAATVVDVYPNGNLLVSGEKKLAINTGDEFIRFSGVINPANVTSQNTVQSVQVADARIEYKGSGYIDEAQSMGWMQRFFNVILPF